MILQASFRALGNALGAVGRRMAQRGVSIISGDGAEIPPDKYVWNRYTSDLCDRCKEKERRRASIFVYPDGRIVGNFEDIPPLHPNCDCAMRNERTGQFAFGKAGGGPV